MKFADVLAAYRKTRQKIRLRELARGDYAIPAVEAILGRKLGSGVKDALRNRGQRIHTPPSEFVGKKLKSEAEAQLKGKGLAGERQVQYTDVVPTLVLPDRFRPGEATPQWYTPRYGIHNSQVTPSKLRSILKDGLKAKPASGGQPPLLFMHPSGESAGVVGKFPHIRNGRGQGTLSFLTENPGDFSYSRGGAPGSITSKVPNKRSWIVDPDFYGGKPLSGKIKQVLDETGTKPIIPETIQGDGVTLLYPKEYFGDYNRNYWAKKIRENRSKNLSAKLRLRELVEFNTFGATRNLLRDLKATGVAVSRKGAGSFYSGSKNLINIPRGQAGLAEGVGRRNALFHEAGHAKVNAGGGMDKFHIEAHNADQTGASFADKMKVGNYGNELRKQERLANQTAQADMERFGVPKENIAAFRKDMAGSLNTYRAGHYAAPSAKSYAPTPKATPLPEANLPSARVSSQPQQPQSSAFNKKPWLGGVAAAGVVGGYMAARNRGVTENAENTDPTRNKKYYSAKLRLREFSALRKRIRVKWHSDGSARMTIPNAYGGVNEIGRIETSVSSQRAANVGQVKWVEIDPKFRGMGLATKMYGEAMKSAPRGRLVSDNTQYGGGYGVWNKLQRNKGYKIRENPKIDGAGFDDLISRDGRPMFIGRINPAARKQNNLSAKLRLRELASALRSRLVVSVVPASMGGSRIYDATLAGKRVGSISVHDRFARDLFGNITGKKTPKISRSNVEEQFRGMGIGKKLYSEVIKREGRVMSDSSVSGEARRVYESLKKNKNIKIRTLPATETPGGLLGRNGVYQQRPPGLSNGFGGRPVFAVQWKGRKDLSAKLRLRELARGDYAIPALGKMLKDRSLLEEFLTSKRGPKLGDLMASKVGNGLRHSPIRVKGPLFWGDKSVMEGVTHSIKNPASTAAREGIAMGLKARDLRVREMYPASRQNARDAIAKMLRKGRAGGDVYEAVDINPEYGFSAKLR